MVDLSIQIFEIYTLQDVLGEAPPADTKLRENLESIVCSLIKKLNNKTNPDLQKILLQHLRAKQEMTKFSGAQAMDQSKIEMFHEFLSKYITAIESKIK